jgi:CBS domain-containing membrane protein
MANLRGFGPAMAGPKTVDIARAGLGAGIGLLVLELVLHGTGIGWLIGPFGASALLINGVPNSPLAQPWSVVIGNTGSALVALAVLWLLPSSALTAPLAVTLAIALMMGLRALHPPGGAMALLVTLGTTGPAATTLSTVLIGSTVLVAVGIGWNRVVGRVYPFRQPRATGAHGTTDPAPEARLGLTPTDLAAILETYRQSANLGVADLARLVGAVEQASAARAMEGFTAADIMSRDLVTVGPDAPLGQVADLFRKRGFSSIPVVDDDRLLGLIFQIDLIRRAREDAFRKHHSLLAALISLIDDHRASAPKAGDILQDSTATVAPDTPVGALLSLLADGGAEAVPVVKEARIVGIVTRSDLVSALTHRLAEQH